MTRLLFEGCLYEFRRQCLTPYLVKIRWAHISVHSISNCTNKYCTRILILMKIRIEYLISYKWKMEIDPTSTN